MLLPSTVAAIIITAAATTLVTAVGIALIVGIVLHTTGTAIPAIVAAIAMSRTTNHVTLATIAGNR